MKASSRAIALFCLACLFWVGCAPPPPSISLHKAIEQGDLKAVQQHIAAKTDLNARDSIGRTPLYVAASKGNLAIAQALVAAGADPQNTGGTGKTPLEVARERGQTAVVQFLQGRGQAGGGEKPGRGLVDGGLGVSQVLDNP